MPSIDVVGPDASIDGVVESCDVGKAIVAVGVVQVRRHDRGVVEWIRERPDWNGFRPASGGGVVGGQVVIPRPELRVFVQIVLQHRFDPDQHVVRQVGVDRFVGGDWVHGADTPEHVQDVDVVFQHRARRQPRHRRVKVVPILGHWHRSPWVQGRHAVLEAHGFEVRHVWEGDARVGLDEHVGVRRHEFRRGVGDVDVAEQGDAVHREAFDDGQVVGRSIGQIVVVVVRLKDVEQHIRVRLPLLPIAHGGLQPRVRIHKQSHGRGPIATQQQVGVVPSATNDLPVGVHLAHDVLGIHLGVFVVHADAVLVVRVKSLADLRNVRQRHSPQIRIAFVHCAVDESREQGLVELVVDRVTVLVVHDVRDE